MTTVSVAVRIYGEELHFDMPGDGATVLAAARAAGIHLPSSCEAGICATCRAKLVAGEVTLLNDLGLDEADRAAGYVLACQAVPQSTHIDLDFDG